MKITKYSNIWDLPDTYLAGSHNENVSLFGKPGWFDLLQKHIVKNDEQMIYYCVVNDNETIDAIFPLIKSSKGTNSQYLLKSLANFYTMEYEPYFIKKTRNSNKAIKAFVKYLATEEPDWYLLEFFPIEAEKLNNIYLRKELSKYFKISCSLCHKNWIYRTNGESFKEYVAFSPSRIKNIRRKERQLVKNHDVKFMIWTDGTDIEKSIQDYFTIYNSSWKDEEQYPDFIPDLIQLCVSEKVLRLGFLYVDDVPTAVQFNIFHTNVTLIYKLGYNEEYKHLSVGAILSFKMMEYAFDKDKSAEIDYGCGDDEYKKEWMNNCKEKITLSAYNNNLPGKYCFMKQYWKSRIRQFITY